VLANKYKMSSEAGVGWAAPYRESGDPRSPRRVTRRQVLPGGRAVVGGLLVAAAAVGTYAAHGVATGAPTTRYVVAARDVAPGRTLTAADLATVAVELPAAQRAVSFTDLTVLSDSVTLSALRAGQLVASSDVARTPSNRGLVEMSVPVDPARAMNGERRYLRGGDRVDVVATVSTGGKAASTTVATGAEIIEVLDPRGGIGGGSALTVVLAVRPADSAALAGASAGASISLVRVTGANP
jgi:Flp pilus assembly protein CpaB